MIDEDLYNQTHESGPLPPDSTREQNTNPPDYTEADLGSVDLAADPTPDPESINQGPGQGEDQMVDDAGDQGVIGGPDREPV